MIRQRTPSDCGVCTIAMALGQSYESVYATAIKVEAFIPDKGMRSEYRVLEEYGLEQSVDFKCLHRDWAISSEFFRLLAWGRRAIMAVPSLNIEGGWHSVYWDGNRLLDPCLRKTYSKWDELKPNEIILFNEKSA